MAGRSMIIDRSQHRVWVWVALLGLALTVMGTWALVHTNDQRLAAELAHQAAQASREVERRFAHACTRVASAPHVPPMQAADAEGTASPIAAIRRHLMATLADLRDRENSMPIGRAKAV